MKLHHLAIGILSVTIAHTTLAQTIEQQSARAHAELNCEFGDCCEDKLKTAQQELGKLKQQSSSLMRELSTKDQRIETLQASILPVKNQLAQCESEKAGGNTAAAEQIAALKVELAKLKSQLQASSGSNAVISELEGKVKALSNELRLAKLENQKLAQERKSLPAIQETSNLESVGNVKKIKIASAINDWIQISEVVAVDAITGKDVALSSAGAKVIPSSTGFGGEAFNAIDGIGPAGHPRLFHSGATGATQYLIVELARPTSLREIKIMGRADSYWNRDVFSITLYDANETEILSRNHLDARGGDHTAVAKFAKQAVVPVVAEPPKQVAGLSGVWNLDANGYKGKLEFYSSDDGINARVNFDVAKRWEPITEIAINGSTITFQRPSSNQSYKGTIAGKRILGQFTAGAGVYAWQAEKPE